MATKRRRADAVRLDLALTRECERLLEKGEVPSARRLAQNLKCQPSTLTRDPVRSSIVAKFRAEFESRKQWGQRLEKSSARSGAVLLHKKEEEIKELQRQVDALLISHRSMIDFLRARGSFEEWRAFLARYVEVEKQLIELKEVEPFRA